MKSIVEVLAALVFAAIAGETHAEPLTEVRNARSAWTRAASTLIALKAKEPELDLLLTAARYDALDAAFAAEPLAVWAIKLSPVTEALQEALRRNGCEAVVPNSESLAADAISLADLQGALLVGAAAAYQQKQPLRAKDALLDLARFGKLTAGCGVLIEHIIGLAGSGTGLERLHWLVRRGELAVADLERLHSELAALVLPNDGLGTALKGELAYFAAEIALPLSINKGEEIGHAFGKLQHERFEAAMRSSDAAKAQPKDSELAKAIEAARRKSNALAETLASVFDGHPSALNTAATLTVVGGFHDRLAARSSGLIPAVDDALTAEIKRYTDQALIDTAPLKKIFDAEEPTGFLRRLLIRWQLRRVPNPLGQFLAAGHLGAVAGYVQGAHADRLQAQTLRNAVEAVIALHIWYARTKKWPDTVEVLPINAFTDKPMRYAASPPRFLTDERSYDVIDAVVHGEQPVSVDPLQPTTHADCPRVKLSGKDVDAGLGEGFDTIIQSMRLVPDTKENEMFGFRVVSVSADGIGPKICLEKGDTILQVNDLRLTTPESGFALFESLRDQKQITLRLLRGDAEHSVTIEINR